MNQELIEALDDVEGSILLAIDSCNDIYAMQDLKSYLEVCIDEIRRIRWLEEAEQ